MSIENEFIEKIVNKYKGELGDEKFKSFVDEFTANYKATIKKMNSTPQKNKTVGDVEYEKEYHRRCAEGIDKQNEILKKYGLIP